MKQEEEEKKQLAMIDWNEFVVVETVDFFEDEALPDFVNVAKENKGIV